MVISSLTGTNYASTPVDSTLTPTDIAAGSTIAGTVSTSGGTVTLTITNINRAPTAVADAYTLGKNNALTISGSGVLANDTDLDGDSLTAIKITDPTHGTLTLNANGGFTYTPASNYFGADTFTYQASDLQLGSNVVTVALTVTPVNDAPVATDDAYNTPLNAALTIAA